MEREHAINTTEVTAIVIGNDKDILSGKIVRKLGPVKEVLFSAERGRDLLVGTGCVFGRMLETERVRDLCPFAHVLKVCFKEY